MIGHWPGRNGRYASLSGQSGENAGFSVSTAEVQRGPQRQAGGLLPKIAGYQSGQGKPECSEAALANLRERVHRALEFLSYGA